MITIDDIKRTAGRENVPRGTIEKDAILSIALKTISQTEIVKNLVFKGGTTIKKVYYPDARFSEDLDFTIQNVSREKLVATFETIFNNQTIEGIKFGELEKEKTSEGLKATLKYTGPLNYPNRIRFDFSFRDNIIQKPEQKPLIDSYSLGAATIPVLTIQEIFAEKIHALGSRSAPRDLYDTWFLLNKRVKQNQELIQKKFAYYNEKLDFKKIIKHIQEAKTNWKKDLGPLVKNLPEYEKIVTALKKMHFIPFKD